MSFTKLSLESLVQCCAEETAKFRRREEYDPRPCLELFRRAIVLQDQAAWKAVYQHYRLQVLAWVRRHWAYSNQAEPAEALVNEAFSRFWQAMTPQRFARLQTLGGIMAYLRRCVDSAVREAYRRTSREQLLDGQIKSFPEAPTERLRREELWCFVFGQLRDEKERVVVDLSFRQGLPPRKIFAERRDLFSSVREVYQVKRNVLARLRRNPYTKEFLDLRK